MEVNIWHIGQYAEIEVPVNSGTPIYLWEGEYPPLATEQDYMHDMAYGEDYYLDDPDE